MAEAVVGFLLAKLANIIEIELVFLGGVGKKVKRVQRELIRIQCCLRDADTKRKGDERVQNWLNELRDVAYRIEDVIDTFFLEIDDNTQKKPIFLQKLKKLWNKPLLLHKLGNELDDIQNILQEISKSRIDYGIKELQDESKGESVIIPVRRAIYHEVVDETEVVGVQADINNILMLLRPEKTLRRAVITIVGAGGLGKTTLAHMVYKSARAKFEYHMMLAISQQFSLIDLLRKMLRQLEYSTPDNLDVGDLINKLKSFLSSRKYLIILDDVWTADLWDQLKYALPDVNNGSRILMTSRLLDVAKSADSQMTPYELNLLDDKKSLDLLLKKAFSYQEPHKEFPSDLLKLANQLSKKCKGLPLALIVVGGILLNKEQNYHAWERVLRTMDWHSEGKGCMDVLAMSYEDMPYYLKACFQYLAAFPEDYEISAKRVIKMRVAEGFLPQKAGKTMDETAEDSLEELFQRSMVQVSSRSKNGSIKCCQVHDLLRDLAMYKARQENFFMVYSEASDVNHPNKEIRRASLQYCNQQFMEYVGPNTRSLLWFSNTFGPLPNCSNFRLIKVLEFVGVRTYVRNLNPGLDELINLKYLGFRNCDMNISSCSFGRMKTRETLDTRGTKFDLDNDLWRIGTLRHVLCDDPFRGLTLDAPISTSDISNLQTLQWVKPPRKWDRRLSFLKNLRKLSIGEIYDGDVNWVTITNLAT